MACLPATWLTVQIAFDTDRGSDHYRIGSGAGEERAIPDDHEVEHLPGEDLGGCSPTQCNCRRRHAVASVSGASEPSFCFFARSRMVRG